ncbi:MAG: AAA family ATPase [Phycisphaerales bacterium]|nr:AAA family ATPase [Phycisphaerales bacterium]
MSTPPATPPPVPLPATAVRWRCDPSQLTFETTRDVEPARAVVGQDAAVEALRFGLEHHAAGQNIFVRGLVGTGRMSLIRQLLEHIVPACPVAPDRCFVHNFEQPDRPRLITLPRGTAEAFAERMDEVVAFIEKDLHTALSSESIQDRQARLERSSQERAHAIIEPFEQELEAAGLAYVSMQAGPVNQGILLPLHEGKPTPPEEYDRLHETGVVSTEEYERVTANHEKYSQRLQQITQQVLEQRIKDAREIRILIQEEARTALRTLTNRIARDFDVESVRTYLDEVVEDVVQERLGSLGEVKSFSRLYRVNVVLCHEPGDACPIVVEHSPTVYNLLGTIDIEMTAGGAPRSDHMMIRAGSLLRSDGGYLILDSRDVLSEPAAWRFLVRTLRNDELEIVPPELSFPFGRQSIKPEPIALNIKVIMIGEADTYYVLDELDPDFRQLFKVLADFDSEIPRDAEGIHHYAAVVSRIAGKENLPPFDRSAVAALVEHGARIASRRGKLTARFSRLGDIVREAAFITRKDGRDLVTGADVTETVRRTKRRADLPSRRFRELLADGTIKVLTSGRVAGQINGLAVLRAGQLTYGFPARITATCGAGSAGVVNIEREANLSGAIHTKGFYILSGLLRHLLPTLHPLAFAASIAFEQSYGGIDGDSASGAEICCLLSALTGVPIRQDIAMTGAIDQAGHIMAIGGANEKIEGFFDTCQDGGLTGTQGVIIPAANAGDLMLRADVVEACRAGRFHVWAIDRVHDALELLTGMPTGELDSAGGYPPGTLLHRAMTRAHDYWRLASKAVAPAPAPLIADQANTAGGPAPT